MTRLAIVAAIALASCAFAAPRHISLPLGQTRLVSAPEEIATFTVGDPDVVEVRRVGEEKLSLAPKAPGKSKVQFRTASDAEVELIVFVTTGGDVEVLSPR